MGQTILTSRFRPWRWAAWVLCLAVVLLPACGRGRRVADRGTAPRARPTEARIDAILGRTLVIPVTLEGAINPARPIPVRVDDGRRLNAELFWISVRDDGKPTWDWLAPAGRWAATPATASSRPSPIGFWALVMDLPFNAVGQGLWIGQDRYPLNWLPDPSLIREREDGGPWRPPLGDSLPQRLLTLAAAEARSPVRRWRSLLLTQGLRPPKPEAEDYAASRFDDSVLEALARQTEARWRIALALLWSADADLAERVKRRLAGAADFGQGVVAPAWPTSSEDLGSLLADLLTPRLEPERRAERAAAWLETLPDGAAWVIDDAGLRDAPSGRSIATLGLANLTERTTLGWVTTAHDAHSPELASLASQEAKSFAAIAPPPVEAGTRPVVPVTLNVGRWSTVRQVAMDRLPAAPPGLRIPALVGDWTMSAWLAGEPDTIMLGEPEWATAGLLHRAADGSDQWWLYLECRRPPGERGRETVRVWLGPTGRPSAVLRISSDGAAVDERAIDQGLGQRAAVQVAAHEGKWLASIPIPPHCVEPDGTLRIAVERTDARGRRSAWPRPMLPWQPEPGRITADLGAWASLPAATPASATR